MMSASVVSDLPFAKRQGKRTILQIDLDDIALHHLGTESLRLRPHFGHEIRPHDAVAEPRPVLDHRGEHQLTASLESLDQQWLEIRAGA